MITTKELIQEFLLISQKISIVWDKVFTSKYDITHKNALILDTILHKWSCTITEIKKVMMTSDAAISKTIKQLEEKWLINRQKLWQSNIITLTEKWEKLIKKITKSMCWEFLMHVDEQLTKEDKKSTEKFISVLNSKINILESKLNNNEEII